MKKGLADLTALIRSIQKREGNEDCFRRGKELCDQFHCAWREYCLEEPKVESMEKCLSPSRNADQAKKDI
jgi:hypothetical protein